MPFGLLLIFLPWTPPPAKPVAAVPLPLVQVIPPADPFADPQLVDARRLPRDKTKLVGGLPLVLGLPDLK